MIKKFLLLLLLVAAVLAAAPWLTGTMIEKRYHAMLQQTASESGLRISLLGYQRGWFSSEAKSRIEFPAGNGKTESMVVLHHIRHGLLIFDGSTPYFGLGLIHHDIELPPSARARWQALFGDTPPLTMRTSISLNGNQHWQIESKSLYYHKQQDEVLIQPLHLTLQIGAALDTVAGVLHWNGLKAITDKGTGDIAPMEWHFDMQRIRPFVWTGDLDWQQGTISFINPFQHVVISGLKLASHTRSDNRQRLFSEQSAELAAFDIAGSRYGPGKLAITIRNIPHRTIEHFARLQQKAAKLSASGKAEAQLALQQLGMSALGELPALISADPIIEIPALSLQTPEGEIKGSFHFSIRDVASGNAMNLPLIKQHSHMRLDLQVPAALLVQYSQQLASMMQQGMIRREGGMLVTHARLENGTLMVNGRSVPLPF